MSQSLYHPTWGYYNRVDLKRWGKDGDYRTSPERSELFAATFARYFVSLYEHLGCPPELRIVEMGAGNGRFAAGLLKCLHQSFPSLLSKTRYVVVEVSKDARQRVFAELTPYSDRVQFAELQRLEPMGQAILFSNELLDAFPVHRLTMQNGVMKEMYVSLSDGRFCWVVDELSSSSLKTFCDTNIPSLLDGQIVEANTEIANWCSAISDKLITGYLVTVDYGAEARELYSATERSKGSLRAFRRHEFVDDILSDPGECDITSTVDWTLVKAEGRRYGFQTIQFAQLDKFLMQAGILEELESRLNSDATQAAKSSLTT